MSRFQRLSFIFHSTTAIHKSALLVCLALCCLLLSACDHNPEVRQDNLFQAAGTGERKSWKPDGNLTLSPFSSPEGFSLTISSPERNDISHLRRVWVQKGCFYKFSALVKTEQVKGRVGANLSIYGTYNHSRQRMVGDTGWTYLEQVFRASADEELEFGLRLGFWDSPASGTAQFREVQLTELAEWAGSYQAIQKTPPSGPRSSMQLRYFVFFGFVPWFVGFLYSLRQNYFPPHELAQQNKAASGRQTFYWLLLGALLYRCLWLSNDSMGRDLDLLRDLAVDLGQPHQLLQIYGLEVTGQYPLLLNFYYALVGALVRLGNWELSPLFPVLLKLPALAAELAVGALLFHTISASNQRLAWLLAALFLFNPALVFSSSFWGQPGAVSAGLLIFALYALYQGRPLIAGLLLGALASYQLHWPFLLLLLFTSIVLQKNFRGLAYAATGSAISLCAGFLPAVQHQSWGDLFAYFSAQVNGPGQLSLGAFNLWSLLGLHPKTAAEQFLGLPAGTLGLLLAIGLQVALIFWLGRQVTDVAAEKAALAQLTEQQEKLWPAFALLSFGLYLFLPGQQEQHLLPALFLLAFLTARSRGYARVFWGLSCLAFINQIFVFWFYAYRFRHPPTDAWVQLLGGGILLLLFLLLMAAVLGKRPVKQNLPFQLGPVEFYQPFAMRGRDWLGLAAIWLLALGLLLYNLGDLQHPVQGYQLGESVEIFELELETACSLAAVGFYGGEIAPEVRFEAWDGQAWMRFWRKDRGFLVYPSKKDYRKTFKNHRKNFPPFETSRLRITVQGAGAQVLELGLFDDKDRQLVPKQIRAVSEEGSTLAATEHPFFDEQAILGPFRLHSGKTYWDEVFYTRSAYNLVNGQQPYEKTHPPLGKTLIGWGIRFFEMTPFGWRIVPALAVSLLPLLLFQAGRLLTGRRLVAWLAAALCLVESLTFGIGRMANIDGFLVLFETAMLVALLRWFLADEGKLRRSNLPWLLLAGVCFGLAASIKWSALFMGFAIFLLLVGWQLRKLIFAWRADQRRNYLCHELPTQLLAWGGCFLLLPLLIYYLSHYEFLQTLEGQPSPFSLQGLQAFWQQQQFILGFHGGKKAFESHSLASPFYTWPLLYKPVQEIFIATKLPENYRSAISMVGNPVIFWSGFIAMLGWGWRALGSQCKRAIFLAGVYFFTFLPWILVQRPSFFYAYFPFVPVLILGLATAVAAQPRFRIPLSLGLLTAASLMFAFFYPAISGLPMPEDYFTLLHWFESWSKF